VWLKWHMLLLSNIVFKWIEVMAPFQLRNRVDHAYWQIETNLVHVVYSQIVFTTITTLLSC